MEGVVAPYFFFLLLRIRGEVNVIYTFGTGSTFATGRRSSRGDPPRRCSSRAVGRGRR
jgi:hypothetical protein